MIGEESVTSIILANTIMGICGLKDRKIIWANDKFLEIFGYSRDEAINKSTIDFFPDQEAFRRFGVRAYLDNIHRGTALDEEGEFVRRDGAHIWCRVVGRGVRDADLDSVWLLEDLTEKMRSDASLKKKESQYEQLLAGINDWVWEIDADGKIRYSNAAANNAIGRRPSEIIGTTIYDLMSEPEGRRVREAVSQFVARKTAVSNFSCAVKHADGRDVFLEINGKPILDDKGVVCGYQGVARDISDRLRAAALERDYEKALRRGLISVANAMSLTIELRDPYTYGHQSRTARLARDIGAVMGMTRPETRNLEIGALVHDIGKVAIPSEILSRPGRLSPEETALIRTHVTIGHRIIKDVNLPAPIPDMVLQHHERLDGSGYPNGLSGEEILLESRILSVSDVVEAMSAHRPYRPAIGIDAGLDEVDSAKGRLYDPDVVSACRSVLAANKNILTDSEQVGRRIRDWWQPGATGSDESLWRAETGLARGGN